MYQCMNVSRQWLVATHTILSVLVETYLRILYPKSHKAKVKICPRAHSLTPLLCFIFLLKHIFMEYKCVFQFKKNGIYIEKTKKKIGNFLRFSITYKMIRTNTRVTYNI